MDPALLIFRNEARYFGVRLAGACRWTSPGSPFFPD